MRRVLTLVSTLLLIVAGCSSGNDTPGALPEQRVEAGAITVSITPARVDDRGATFDIVLDTHSEELSMDLTSAELEVDGTPWRTPRWTGDGPDGHHRSGQLEFVAAGPARGTAVLTLNGFPAPVRSTWNLDAG